MNPREERLLRLAQQDRKALVELLRLKHRSGDEEGFDMLLFEQAKNGTVDGELLFEFMRILLDWGGEPYTRELACDLGLLMGATLLFDAWNIANEREHPELAELLIEVYRANRAIRRQGEFLSNLELEVISRLQLRWLGRLGA